MFRVKAKGLSGLEWPLTLGSVGGEGVGLQEPMAWCSFTL